MLHQPELSIYTVLFTFVICLCPCSVSGTIFYSNLGTRCLEHCRLYDNKHQCETITEDGLIDTLYCSPEDSLDHNGSKCTSPCWKDKTDHYWCTGWWTWGYCGRVEEDQNHYTQYGDKCLGTCAKHGENYYWCKTKRGWDYCSIEKNVDYQGYDCHQDHPCGKHGESYHWCKRTESGWGYCGLVEALPKQNYISIFRNDLQLDNPKAFDCPYTADFLSGLEQESRHSGRRKRQVDEAEVIDIKIDEGNCFAIVFRACPGRNAIRDGTPWSNNVTNLISHWDNGRLRNQPASRLIYTPTFRIDLQGLVNRDNQQYYNLQIQMNVPRRPQESTTVSQVLLPKNTPYPIPDRYVRRAFTESLIHVAGIIVEFIVLSPQAGLKQYKG